MSYNMFPNSNHLQLDTRGGPIVEERGHGPYAYGSWNTEYPLGDMEMEDDAHVTRVTTQRDLFGSEVFDENTVREILNGAFERARGMVNYRVGISIRRNTPQRQFNDAAFSEANDLVEQGVYQELKAREVLELKKLTPQGLVSLIDRIMSKGGELTPQIEQELIRAYNSYIGAMKQIF